MSTISSPSSHIANANATSDTNLTTSMMSQMATTESNDIALTSGDSNKEAIFAAIDFLIKYIYSFITIQGILTNFISILVLTRPTVSKTSVSWYLLMLAVTDTLVLVLDFVNNYFKEVLKIKTIGMNTTVCVLYRYAFNVLFTTSSWLVVIVTLERMLAVCLPMKVMVIASRTKARFISLGIFLFIAIYNCFNLWVWEAKDQDCDWASGWETFHSNAYMLMTGFLYSYIPTLSIFMFNIIIIYKIKGAAKTRAKLQNEAGGNTSTESRKITMTVLAVSFAFLILTVPLSVYYIIQYSMGQFIEMTPEMALGEILMLLLGLLNHGINFWLYVFTSASFRKALVSLMRCKGHEARYLYSGGGTDTQDRNTKTMDLSTVSSEVSGNIMQCNSKL